MTYKTQMLDKHRIQAAENGHTTKEMSKGYTVETKLDSRWQENAIWA